VIHGTPFSFRDYSILNSIEFRRDIHKRKNSYLKTLKSGLPIGYHDFWAKVTRFLPTVSGFDAKRLPSYLFFQKGLEESFTVLAVL